MAENKTIYWQRDDIVIPIDVTGMKAGDSKNIGVDSDFIKKYKDQKAFIFAITDGDNTYYTQNYTYSDQLPFPQINIDNKYVLSDSEIYMLSPTSGGDSLQDIFDNEPHQTVTSDEETAIELRNLQTNTEAEISSNNGLSLFDSDNERGVNIGNDGGIEFTGTNGDSARDEWQKELGYLDYEYANIYGGKNLLITPDINETVAGVTFTKNDDGSITVNGTATNNVALDLKRLTATDFVGYLISGCILGSSTTYGLRYRYPTENAHKFIWIYDGESKLIVNNGEVGDNLFYVGIYIYSGTVMNNVTFYPMIRHASITDDTYEPYAMTNYELTDKVTELESAGGESLFESGTGTNSIKSKNANSASGNNSVAIGYNSNANYQDSIAIGLRATSDGIGSTAIGAANTADGRYLGVFGYGNTVTGNSSAVVGNSNTVASESLILGVNNNCQYSNGIVTGKGNIAGNANQTIIGNYNERVTQQHRIIFGIGRSDTARKTVLQITEVGGIVSASGKEISIDKLDRLASNYPNTSIWVGGTPSQSVYQYANDYKNIYFTSITITGYNSNLLSDLPTSSLSGQYYYFVTISKNTEISQISACSIELKFTNDAGELDLWYGVINTTTNSVVWHQMVLSAS